MALSLRFARPFLLICLALALWLLLLLLSPFATPLILATVIATLFHPAYRALNRELGGMPNLAAFLFCLLVTFLIVLPILLLAINLAGEAQQALETYQQSENGFQVPGTERLTSAWNRVNRALGLPQVDLRDSLRTATRDAVMFVLRNSSSILAGFANLVFDFFVMIFTVFFLLRDGPALTREVLSMVPLESEDKQRLVVRFREAIHATFLGSFATALAQGLATWLVLFVLDFRSSVLLGTLAGFGSFVPMIGAGIVWIPAAGLLFLQGLWVKGLILTVCGAVGISLLDNIIRPWVMQRASGDIHTLLIFLGILGGIAVFGFSGLVVGPVIVAFSVTILDIVKSEFAERKKTAR